MLSFKEYLAEVKRSDSRALKLGSYIADRWWSGHRIQFKGADEPSRASHFSRKWSAPVVFGPDPRMKPREVDTASLRASQPGTSWDADYAQRVKFKDDQPIRVMKKDGKKYIMQGHHRFMAAKLKGEKKMKAFVYSHDELEAEHYPEKEQAKNVRNSGPERFYSNRTSFANIPSAWRR